MKDRPIIFTAESVRGILAGRKTQTRRLVRMTDEARKDIDAWSNLRPHALPVESAPGYFRFEGLPSDSSAFNSTNYNAWCPYGVPGDRLWAKEAFAPLYFDDGRAAYRSDWTALAAEVCAEPKWTSPLFMPRAKSRITLEVVRVGLDRLQTISQESAVAEGIRFHNGHFCGSPHRIKGHPKCFNTAVEAYADIWDHINGTRAPWSSNPWVWALTFKVVEPRAKGALEAGWQVAAGIENEEGSKGR